MIDWLTDWWLDEWGKNDWLTDWLIDRSIDWLIDWLIDRLIDWLSYWLIDWLIDWLIGWLSPLGKWYSSDGPSSSRGQQPHSGRFSKANNNLVKGHQVGFQDDCGGRAVPDDDREHDIRKGCQKPDLAQRWHTTWSMLRQDMRSGRSFSVFISLQKILSQSNSFHKLDNRLQYDTGGQLLQLVPSYFDGEARVANFSANNISHPCGFGKTLLGTDSLVAWLIRNLHHNYLVLTLWQGRRPRPR